MQVMVMMEGDAATLSPMHAPTPAACSAIQSTRVNKQADANPALSLAVYDRRMHRRAFIDTPRDWMQTSGMLCRHCVHLCWRLAAGCSVPHAVAAVCYRMSRRSTHVDGTAEVCSRATFFWTRLALRERRASYSIQGRHRAEHEQEGSNRQNASKQASTVSKNLECGIFHGFPLPWQVKEDDIDSS